MCYNPRQPRPAASAMKVAIVYPNLDGTVPSLDMGVAYLATYLKERTGHQVRIIDPTFRRRDWRSYIEGEIRRFQPDAVGISVVSLYFDYAREIARRIKRIRPVPMIVGGFQAMMAPEETMRVPEFDALCIGDGEEALAEWLQALEGKRDLSGVRGIWYRRGGEIVRNEPRPHNPDLDSLPVPDYDLFADIDKYLYFLQRLYVIGSRGCPYDCAFCAESMLKGVCPGRRFRLRDPRRYVREIKVLYDRYRHRGMKAAHLYDSVFSFDLDWLKAWADEYRSLGLDRALPYSAFLKADRHNASEEKLDLMKESGCVQVRIGMESGDDAIRETVLRKKGSSGSVFPEIVDSCNRRGIIVKTYAIFGIPGDTKRTIRATYNLARRMELHVPLFFSYTPLPGTDLATRAAEMNESADAQTMYSFHYSRGAKNPGVPPSFVPRMILKSYLVFGGRLVWMTFLANPMIFLPRIISRLFRGVQWSNSILSAFGYALISPEFWPALSSRIERRWLRKHRSRPAALSAE